MTRDEWTIFCAAIYNQLPVAIRANLEADDVATVDHEGRPNVQAIKFCMWGKPKLERWDRDYASFHLVHDPLRQVSAKEKFQVRFMFFLRRKETGHGKFNQIIQSILKPLDGQRGFNYAESSMLAELYKGTDKSDQLAPDLLWLISQVFPKIHRATP